MDLQIKQFKDIDLSDSFFDSLRVSYDGFDNWFKRKASNNEVAYTYYENLVLKDFLYLKIEEGVLDDIFPVLPFKKRLKVGTFKIDNRGTKRGERFMKKIMDRAIDDEVEEIYVTIFPEERLLPLIHMFETYGFCLVATKKHKNGKLENVYIKNMSSHLGNVLLDYPFVNRTTGDNYVLSIYPKYHTQMFPDSKLKTEDEFDLINDVSETNSIFKVYICWMRDVWKLKPNDKVVIYRTTDIQGQAYYHSVATSICTVFEVKTYRDFDSEDTFFAYMKKNSVFNEAELRYWYNKKSNFTVIKMIYNVAFKRRIIMRDLIEKVGISKNVYWGFFKISNEQLNTIIKLSKVNERYFVD